MTELPGPGNYESDMLVFGKNGQKVGIRGKSKEMKHLEVPGPGSYDNKDSLIKSQARSVRIGSSSRGDIVDKKLMEMPGPGNYSETVTFGKNGISATISGKRKEPKASEQPGPGSYE